MPRKPYKDPVYVKLRSAWARSKCQARFRGQEWHIPFELYYDMWMEDNRYLSKGNGKGSLVFCRKDIELDWTPDNVTICDRKTYNKQQLQGELK